MLDDACPKCHGTGEQPDGWTLEQARKEPKIFHIKRLEAEYGPGHGMVTFFNVVSPILFLDNGKERCIGCHGSGITHQASARRVQEARDKREEYFRNLIGGTETIDLPDGNMFITITAYFNDSDSMSDYYAPHRSLSNDYVIAMMKKGKRTEKRARAIVALIPELAKLEWSWYTENYSGGHGTWLQSEVVGEYEHKCYDGTEKAHYWYEIRFNPYSKREVKSKLFVGEKPVY
jgi:hypothetical protein